MNLYGFNIKNFDVKPYFLMLFIMLPIILAASTQIDFLNYYPTFKVFVKGQELDSKLYAKAGLYEILYGNDFVMTELFFRGFIIFTLSRFLGRDCIIPMATMYAFIHFGKPIGETISSFFGGLFLGIIAYETKSIIGGIIDHCGIDYMMEIEGAVGNYFFR